MKLTIGCVGRPGTAWANRTGAWRTNQRPRFLHATCTACQLCALACPEGCIYGKGRNSYYPDYNYCKGCGNCASVCPVDDIVMEPETGKLPQEVFIFYDELEFQRMSTA